MFLTTTITDPDGLRSGTPTIVSGVYTSDEIVVDGPSKEFYFKGTTASNFGNDGTGVTGQALYSFFKDLWVDSGVGGQEADMAQYDFPMLSITNEQFEFIDGWFPNDTQIVTHADGVDTSTTRKMIRTAGWAEVAADGTSVGRRYAGIVSLGTMVDDTDQPYFAQDSAYTATTVDTKYTGPVNEAVQIFGNTAVDATSPLNSDVSGYYKIFVRERGKIYADSDLPSIGVTGGMTYIVYRFPLSNATDLNIYSTLDTEIFNVSFQSGTGTGNTSPWSVYDFDKIDITYLLNPDSGIGRVNIMGAYSNTTTYAVGDVVFDTGNSMADSTGENGSGTYGRWWYVDATTGDSNGATMTLDTGNTWTIWTASVQDNGERFVKDGFYAFHTIVDAENLASAPSSPYTLSGGNNRYAAYEYAAYQLRQTTEIDTATSQNGNIAPLLFEFVGSTLHTAEGVFMDDLKNTDTNDVSFHDWLDTVATYPLFVTVEITFNSNLYEDSSAKFYAYYSDPGGVPSSGDEFGTPGALQVQSSAGVVGQDLAADNSVFEAGASYSFSYAFDGDETGGRTVSTPTDITIISIGLDKGQYVSNTGTITTAGAIIPLSAALERNYSNPI